MHVISAFDPERQYFEHLMCQLCSCSNNAACGVQHVLCKLCNQKL